MKKTEGKPVPGDRIKLIQKITGCMIVFVISVVIGYCTTPEDNRLPVMLANGEVIKEPCSVSVDGKSVALVIDRKAAEEVVARVKNEYRTKFCNHRLGCGRKCRWLQSI